MTSTHRWAFGVLFFAGVLGAAAPAVAQRLEEGPQPERIGDALQPRVLDLERDARPQRAPVVTALALDAAGSLLATAGDDHVVRVWDLAEDALRQRLAGHEGWVRAAAFSSAGPVLATAGDDRRILIWRIGAQEPLRTIGTGAAVYALAFSPDGALLAAAGFDEKVRVFDGRTGEQVRVLDGPGKDLRALAFSPDGRRLAAAGRSGGIRIWSAADGARQRDLDGHRRRVHALVYSPDGGTLASAGEERVVLLWDAATGAALGPLPELPAPVASLAFCGDDRLAAGAADNKLRVFGLTARTVQRELPGHTGTVAALAWDASRGTLVSGGFDTTVRFWRLGPGPGPRWSERPRAEPQP